MNHKIANQAPKAFLSCLMMVWTDFYVFYLEIHKIINKKCETVPKNSGLVRTVYNKR